MNKKELINEINKRNDVNKEIVDKIVEDLIKITKEELMKGWNISLNNFWKIEIKTMKEGYFYNIDKWKKVYKWKRYKPVLNYSPRFFKKINS